MRKFSLKIYYDCNYYKNFIHAVIIANDHIGSDIQEIFIILANIKDAADTKDYLCWLLSLEFYILII